MLYLLEVKSCPGLHKIVFINLLNKCFPESFFHSSDLLWQAPSTIVVIACSPEQLLVMYVPVDRELFSFLQLYISLSPVFNSMFRRSCAYGLFSFRHNNHLVRFRKWSCFWLLLLPLTQLEMSRCLVKNVFRGSMITNVHSYSGLLFCKAVKSPTTCFPLYVTIRK